MLQVDKDYKPNDELNAFLHKRLPINDDEEILGVYRHHWFVYFKIWAIGFALILLIMITATFLTANAEGQPDSYKSIVMGGGIVLSVLIGLGTAVPAWLRSQEQMVVTNESLLQLLQPSPFGSKTSQLSLQHVADVTARKDFFGSVLGFGQITVETPGEQKNYTFPTVSDPDRVTKVIIEAHENFIAALEAGRLPSNLGGEAIVPHLQQQTMAQAQQAQSQNGASAISPEEYQEFLEFKRAKEAYQQQAQGSQPGIHEN